MRLQSSYRKLVVETPEIIEYAKSIVPNGNFSSTGTIEELKKITEELEKRKEEIDKSVSMLPDYKEFRDLFYIYK